jgi:hypothetical protein
MRWPIRGCDGKGLWVAGSRLWVWTMRRLALIFAVLLGVGSAWGQITVPAAAPAAAKATAFHDTRYGVRFVVPPGWSFGRKDHQVSTFHLDARTAPRKAEMRGVASIQFNPFPESTFSGAWFYFSVEGHSNDRECARQASRLVRASRDVETIGGMDFVHGHDERGQICVELRDDVYTAYRKGSCYRFDLTVTTFCAISSGAQEISDGQLADIRGRFEGILGSVVLDWRPVRAASGRHPLP